MKQGLNFPAWQNTVQQKFSLYLYLKKCKNSELKILKIKLISLRYRLIFDHFRRRHKAKVFFSLLEALLIIA
jgi:hypothetical protein